MEKNFEITKVNVTILHRVGSVNHKPIPQYSKVARVTVYFILGNQKYYRKMFTIVSEPIDIEYSEREYWANTKLMVIDEVYENVTTFEDLDKYTKMLYEGIKNM